MIFPVDSNKPAAPPAAPAPEIRSHCWQVGRRNPASLLQCNTYLRTLETGRAPLHVCIDPGSRVDFPAIEQNFKRLIGDVGEIGCFSVNHQDPDVVGNALALCEANPNVSALMTEEVWRLVQHLNFQPRRLHLANSTRSGWMTLGDQHRWQLVATPFCHFRGAMAFYDPELRTLFSGDLFGGLNLLGRVQTYAEEVDWQGIAQFHQIYMPTREALRYAVRQIRALKPAVEIIAPQHGFVIAGDLVPLFLERMHELLVGLDLLAVELDQTYLQAYGESLRCLIEKAGELMGRDEVLSRIRFRGDDRLEQFISVAGDEVRLERQGYTALVKAFVRLASKEPLDVVNSLRSAVLARCCELGIPIPPIGAGLQEESGPATIGSDGINMQPVQAGPGEEP